MACMRRWLKRIKPACNALHGPMKWSNRFTLLNQEPWVSMFTLLSSVTTWAAVTRAVTDPSVGIPLHSGIFAIVIVSCTVLIVGGRLRLGRSGGVLCEPKGREWRRLASGRVTCGGHGGDSHISLRHPGKSREAGARIDPTQSSWQGSGFVRGAD